MKLTSTLVFAALALGCSSSALAAVSTPYIRGTYYEQNGTASCGYLASSSSGGASSGTGSPAAQMCRITFRAPPVGKDLFIRFVSCGVYVITWQITDVYLGSLSGSAIVRKRRIEPQELESSNNDTNFQYYYLVNDPVDLVLFGSPVIEVVLGGPGGLKMECQISGELKNQ